MHTPDYRWQKRFLLIASASVALLQLTGCGGGAGGSAASPATLSADQAAFEALYLSPSSSYSPSWSLPLVGKPVAGTNTFYAHPSSVLASPLTSGAQVMYSSQSSSIANTLSLPSTYSVNRYLVGGKILTDSVSSQRISYQGSAIRDEILATDGTVLSAVLRTGVQNIPLSGLVVNSPPDVAHWFNALFSNPSLLIGTSTWGAGAAYMEYTATNIADRYRVFDAATVTSGSSPTPVASGTNLATLMAAGGIKSDSDAVTYTLSNGAISVISGVTTYVALIQRPKSTSRLYRTYYEIAGNVLTGDLLKAGETLGGSAYDTASNGVTSSHYDARYQLRINKAAVDSLKAAASF